MDKNKALEIVAKAIEECVQSQVGKDTPIVGDNSPIDSMGLVQVCLSLEEKAEELEFEFNWTDGSAMSKSKSIFRSVDTLSDEFLQQYQSKK